MVVVKEGKGKGLSLTVDYDFGEWITVREKYYGNRVLDKKWVVPKKSLAG